MAPGDVLKSPRHSAGTAVDGSQSRVMTGARMEHCRSHFVRLSTSLLLRPPRRCRGRDFVAFASLRTRTGGRQRQHDRTHIAPPRRRDINARNKALAALASLGPSTSRRERVRDAVRCEFRENGLLFGRKVAKLTKRSRARRLDVKNDSLP